MQPLQLLGICLTMCGSSSTTTFQSAENAGVEEGTISLTLQDVGVLQCGRTWILP